jgi:hypothetical protein
VIAVARGYSVPVGSRRTAAVLLIAAGVFYAAWLGEFVLPATLSPLQSYASDLAADGQPHQLLFRTTDFVTGVLLLLSVVPLGRTLERRRVNRRWAFVLLAGLAGFGAATIVDSIFTLDCVTTIDVACRQRELAGQLSAEHFVHLGSSTITQIAVLCVMFALHRMAAGSRWRRWTVALLVIVLTGWLASMALYDVGFAGVPQRVQLLAEAAALVIGGVLLVGARLPEPRPCDRAAGAGAA